MTAGRIVLLRPLVVVLVSFALHRRRRGGGRMLALPVPRTRDLTAPEQRRDHEKCGNDAGSATIEHDGV